MQPQDLQYLRALATWFDRAAEKPLDAKDPVNSRPYFEAATRLRLIAMANDPRTNLFLVA